MNLKSLIRKFRMSSILTGLLLSLVIGPAMAAAPIKIGVLIPGSKTDHGWMESGYNGMLNAEKRYGKKIKVTYIENVSFGDMQQALVNLASNNQLVIGVGGQTQASVYKVARKFRNVKFSIVGGSKTKLLKNVALYDVRQAQIAFVAGATAAMLSKTGVVSYVGGLQIPAIVNAGKEFGRGAKYVNPKIKYIESYTGNFDDVVKAKQATLAAISQGADIHYNILNLGVRGMEEAAREKGTHMIGSYSDYCGDGNPLYVAYSITGVGFQVEYAINHFVHGTWKAGYIPFGLRMGRRASDMVVCGQVPTKVRATILQIEHDILIGKIKTLSG